MPASSGSAPSPAYDPIAPSLGTLPCLRRRHFGGRPRKPESQLKVHVTARIAPGTLDWLKSFDPEGQGSLSRALETLRRQVAAAQWLARRGGEVKPIRITEGRALGPVATVPPTRGRCRS
jgi:hypothetical protein